MALRRRERSGNGGHRLVQAKPGAPVGRASAVEIYGQGFVPPADATIMFRGVDPGVGPLTKFVVAAPDDDA